VNFAVTCRFLLGACDTRFYVRGKNCCNYAENIGRHCTQFICLVFVHPWVTLRLIDLMLKLDAFVLLKD
jgi:hypothetical protein